MKTTLALLCLLAPLAARADFEAVGFSKDDAYVAFIEHGTSEGSGVPWARLTILDVAKNARVGKPVEAGTTPPTAQLETSGDARTEEAAVAQVKALAQAELARLGISEPFRSSKVDGENGFGGDGWEEGGVVQTATRPAPRKPRAVRCREPFKPLLLTVSMSQPDAEPVTLLHEKTVPKDRPCTGQCAPRRVYAHGKAALVMATCSAPGFEGAAEKVVAVAARLPFSLLVSP